MAVDPDDPRARAGADDAAVLAVAAALVLVFAGAELRIAGEPGLPLDDSWIHLRFAENLATGGGFAINPGVPVAGSTAPLWTLTLAAAVAVGLPGLVAAKLLGAVAYGATGMLARRLARAVGLARAPALLAGVAVVAVGRLAWGALSGMEVCLAAAAVTAGALLAARGRPRAAAGVLALATLARPEAGLVLALHVAGAPRPREAAARAGIAALVLAPALVFNLATVGHLVPATAVAKVEGGLLGRIVGVHEAAAIGAGRLGAWLVEWVGLLLADHWALPLLLVVGLGVRGAAGLGWMPWALVLHPLAMAVVAPYRGPAFQTGRYSTHLAPLAVVVAMTGLVAVFDRLPRRPVVRTALAGALALGMLVPLGPASRAYAWGVQNINDMQVRLGRWVAGATPREALLAVNDVGALTYFGHRAIIDLMGLVTPDIVPARRAGEAGILRYLEARCPDYLVIFPTWFPALAARGDLFRPLQRARLAHNVVAGGDEMVVYETAWSRWARPRRPCPGDPGGARP
jgi:hypothetical protein